MTTKRNVLNLSEIIIGFSDALKEKLPESFSILCGANLTIHKSITHILLSGSRGLLGGYRTDSDIDLTLVADNIFLKQSKNEEKVLKEILDITILNWKGKVDLDTAVIFDINNCELKCLIENNFYNEICAEDKGIDCFGLYKNQKGFNGYVRNAGVEVKKIFPVITVWSRNN